MAYSNFSNLDFFVYLQTSIEMVNGKCGFDSMIKNKHEHYTQFCGTCTDESENCPKIVYAVNFCTRYIFCPKHSHETSLKRIGSYLKATQDRGLILNPSSDVFKLDCYPDADFPECMGMNYQQIQVELRAELDLS